MVDAPNRAVTRKILNYHCDSSGSRWIGRQLRGLWLQAEGCTEKQLLVCRLNKDASSTTSVTLVVVAWGEFGRTPRINGSGGRDHWPSVMSCLVAGGGLHMGQVVGATTGRGEQAREGATVCSRFSPRSTTSWGSIRRPHPLTPVPETKGDSPCSFSPDKALTRGPA